MSFTKVTGTLVDIGDLDLTNVGQIQLDSIAGDADANTSITFSGSDVITIATGGSGRLTIGDGALSPVTDNQIDLGTSSLEFKDGYFDGTVTADAFAGPLTGNVTGNVSGTAATVTTAAQTNITSLGTLTTLTVDDITINGSTISDGGDLTLDVAGDIILDAAGNDIKLLDDGTQIGQIEMASSSFNFRSIRSDDDILFKGNDGGSTIIALTLDMSEAGAATFNSHVGIGRAPESDYYSGIKALALGNGAVIYAGTSGNPNLTFNDNLFINSAGNNEYQTSNPGTRLEQFNGTLTFSNAPSGTAGQTATLTEQFRIDSNGDVGIGTNDPLNELDIMGSGYDQIRIGSNKTDNTNKTAGIISTTYTNQSVSVFQMFNQNGSNAVYYGSADGAHRGLQNHYFYVNSNYNATSGHTLAMRITSVGHVGIKAANRFYLDYNSIGNGDTYIDEYAANEVGITTGGSRKLAVSGGNLYVSGSVNANHNFSDERLKENIVVIPNALEKVNSLRGITYTRKDDESVGTGLIAQELEKVLPEAVYEAKMVHELENPDAVAWKSINYGNTVGLLVEAIKELKTELDASKARITTLEG